MSQELGQPMVVEGRRWRRHRCIRGRARRAGRLHAVDRHRVDHGSEPGLPSERPALRSDQDFQPVTNFANTANVVAVNPKFPAKDFKGFLEELKKNPGKYSYGSSAPAACCI